MPPDLDAMHHRSAALPSGAPRSRAPLSPRRRGEEDSKMATRQKLTPSPGITRVDQESTRTHGWVGRVGYRRTDAGWRPQFTSFFGDRSHGSSGDALKAA